MVFKCLFFFLSLWPSSKSHQDHTGLGESKTMIVKIQRWKSFVVSLTKLKFPQALLKKHFFEEKNDFSNCYFFVPLEYQE